jgi:hypothetical protein
LVQDDERLKEERRKAKANRAKYTGVGAEQGRYGGFGSDVSSGKSLLEWLFRVALRGLNKENLGRSGGFRDSDDQNESYSDQASSTRRRSDPKSEAPK